MINIASTHDTANDHYAKIAFKKKSKMGQPTSPKIQAIYTNFDIIVFKFSQYV